MRAEFLDELIRYYGGDTAVGSEPQMCSACNVEPAAFRCSGCSVCRVQCAGCILKKHVDLPLHAIEVHTVCHASETLDVNDTENSPAMDRQDVEEDIIAQARVRLPAWP